MEYSEYVAHREALKASPDAAPEGGDEPRLYVPLGERGGWLQARARQPRGPVPPPVLVDGVFGTAVSFEPGRVKLRMTDDTEMYVSRPEYDAAHAAAVAEMAALHDFLADGL